MGTDEVKDEVTQPAMTTKRPWRVEVSSWTGRWAVVDAGNTIVEEFTSEANARLFAAAPQMYEALQVLVDNGGIGPEDMFIEARIALRAANGGN